MSKVKATFISKPSKASLRSRGLLSNNRSAPNESSVDGRYSLYSTDSENNVFGVSKGLDKCAQLLTNILEINNEKGLKKQQNTYSKSLKKQLPAHHKSRKQIISSLVNKTEGNKMKHPQRKRKSKAIHVPTAVAYEVLQEPSKSEPSHSERVVASTPVPAVDQRKRQQELQDRENVLQQQINQLQEQYDNLQAVTLEDPQSSEVTKKDEVTSGQKATRFVKKSVEFTTNAEKPLIESQKEPKKYLSMPNVEISEEPVAETKKKVRIAEQDVCDVSHETTTADSPSMKGSPGKNEEVAAPSSKEMKQTWPETSPLKHHQSPHKNTDHLRILTYLVGELRAALGNSDVEVVRLLMEIENEIRLLSYPIQSPVTSNTADIANCQRTCKQHDIDTEVALQPLRSENSDLRRKLRIANQWLRDNKMRQKQEIPPQNNINEGVIESLHHQLLEERERNGKERHEKELAEKALSEQKQEKKKLHIVLSEKDEEIDKLHKELHLHKEKTATVTNQMNLQLESSSISLRARDKEVALLNLALEQRDTEIERLTELTRGLQQSLTKVLTNVQGLQPDDVVSEVSSFQSLLDSFRPRGLKVTDLSVNSTLDHHLGENEYRQAREYDKTKHDSSGSTVVTKDVGYNRSPSGSEQQDSISLLGSSEEESTFKQELANLDNAIARLQDNLRDKR